jgi:hypothetical protein
MGGLPKYLPAKSLLPALMVAVAHVVYAPQRAEAACGDYVMIGGRGPVHRDLAPSRRHGAPAASRESSNSPVDHPCSGPFCSGDLPRPFGAPAGPVKIVVRHWGILAAARTLAPVVTRVAPAQDDAVAVSFPASSIYRPPR